MYRLITWGFALVLALSFTMTTTLADEIVLRDGRAFDVEIKNTDTDSITVYFERGETSGTVEVPARQIDPHSYYSIRNRHMEKSAKNHFTLAKFCAENGLFTRAKSQADKARQLDAEYVVRKLALPELVNGVADKILESAESFFQKGEIDKAKIYASTILTEFPETPAAAKAATLIDKIEEHIAAEDEKQRQAAIDAATENQEKAREAIDKEVRPLVKRCEAARKLNNDGLKEKSASKSIAMFEAAAKRFESALAEGMELKKKYAQDKTVSSELDRGIDRVTGDAIGAWINAGGVEMSRGSMKNAGDYAKRALALDPSNRDALAFKSKIELVKATSDKWQRTRRR